MIGSAVHFQHLFHLLARQRGLGKHAPDRPLDHALRVLPEHVLERREPLVPHVAGVPEIALLLELRPVSFTFAAFTITTQSPPFTCGVNVGLCLPRRICATWLANRPSGCPVASTRNQRCVTSSFRKLNVFIPKPSSRSRWVAAANYTRAVRPCQPEGSGLATVTSGIPFSTACPTATCTVCTTPARGARSSFSIFIASTTTRPAPASTRCPSATSTRTTRPGTGARTTAGPAPLRLGPVPLPPRPAPGPSSLTPPSTSPPTPPPPHPPPPSTGCSAP